jgi:hypothetical protein
MAQRNGAEVRLVTRKGYDFAGRFPMIAEAIVVLKVRSCLIDGGHRLRPQGACGVRPAAPRPHSCGCPAVCLDLLELDGGDWHLAHVAIWITQRVTPATEPSAALARRAKISILPPRLQIAGEMPLVSGAQVLPPARIAASLQERSHADVSARKHNCVR